MAPKNHSSAQTSPTDNNGSEAAKSTDQTPGPNPPSPPPSPKLNRSGGSSSQIANVDDLQKTMESVLRALVQTAEILGKQAISVASLGPAVQALYEIQDLQTKYDIQRDNQGKQMQNVEHKLREQQMKYFRESLRPCVDRIIASSVQAVIADRVREQLTVKVPATQRQELQRCRREIIQTKARLYNSEARRHNARIVSANVKEPLMPLLCPLGTTATSTATSAASAALAIDWGTCTEWDIALPTISPHFPGDLVSLVRLSGKQAEALLKDYGLLPADHQGQAQNGPGAHSTSGREAKGGKRGGATSGRSDPANPSPAASREDHLNRFTEYIGLGFEVLPFTPTGGPLVVERRRYAFSR